MDVLFDDVSQITIASPGATDITVSVDRGLTGPRGSKLFVNSGHPQQQTDRISDKYYIYRNPGEELQLNDVYWRTDAPRAYQFRAGPAGSSWVQITGSSAVSATSSLTFEQFGYQRINIEENTTFTLAGHAPGLSIDLLVTNATDDPWTLTYPIGWMWVTHVPTDIQPNQRFLLKLKSFGSANADVVADASASVYIYQQYPEPEL